MAGSPQLQLAARGVCTRRSRSALPLFRLQPNGFANKDLRVVIADLPAIPPHQLTTGQMTYDPRHTGLYLGARCVCVSCVRFYNALAHGSPVSAYQALSAVWPQRVGMTLAMTESAWREWS